MSKVFISSTCYDLRDIRDQLERFLFSRGFTPMLSDKNDVFYDPSEHTHSSCIQAVANCDMMILIIGGRFGGSAVPNAYSTIDTKSICKILDCDSKRIFDKNFDKHFFSITQLEALKAIEVGIPVWTFIANDVYSEHNVYQHNKDKDIDYPSITKKETAKYIFEFINLMRKRTIGNSIFSFSNGREIEEVLNKQFLGIFEKGLKSFKKFTKTDEDILIDTHLEFGKIMIEKMQFDIALDCFKKAYETKYSIIGSSDNNNTITEIIDLIIDVCEKNGDFRKAIQWLQKKLEVQEKIHGKLSQEVSDIYVSMGYIYHEELKDGYQSVACFKKVLEIANEFKAHPTCTPEEGIEATKLKEINVARANLHLTHGYRANEEYDKALECCLPFVKLAETLIAENIDLELGAFIYNAIGEVYSKQGENYELALEYLNKSKSVREKLAQDSPETYQPHYSNSYLNLAFIYNKQGNYDMAIESAHKCLLLRNEVFPGMDLHPRNAIVYTELGCSHLGKSEIELAIECFDKAIKIFKKNKDNSHPDVINVLEHLVDLYEQKQDYVMALEYLFVIYCAKNTRLVESVTYQRMELLYQKSSQGRCFDNWLNSRVKVKNVLNTN